MPGPEDPIHLLVNGVREFAVFTMDVDRRITSWNTGAERVFGYTKEEALGMAADAIFTEEDRTAGVPDLECTVAVDTGEANDDRWHVRKDGSRLWVNGVMVALGDPPRRVLGFAKILRDKTAQREVEDALRESEAQFRTVSDLVPDLLWRAGPGGERTWGNRRWTEYTGQSAEEAAGFGWADAVHPDDRPRAIGEATGAEGPFRAEHRVRRADGTYRWFLVNATPLQDEGGRITAWFGASTDIHDQRTARDTLEAEVEARTSQVRSLSARLAVAEQEERRRIALLLHDDLQQLLHGLSITISLVERAPTDEARGPLIDRADRTISAATALTRSLATELSPSVLHTDKLSDVLRWLATRTEEQTGLDVEVAGDADVGDSTLRALLYHLVREALFNVAKHARTGRARVSIADVDGHVTVTVEDEGAGFDPGVLDGEGAGPRGGFGLASVRERLEVVGGRLEVASTPGEGTRVTLSVPRAARPDTP